MTPIERNKGWHLVCTLVTEFQWRLVRTPNFGEVVCDDSQHDDDGVNEHNFVDHDNYFKTDEDLVEYDWNENDGETLKHWDWIGEIQTSRP